MTLKKDVTLHSGTGGGRRNYRNGALLARNRLRCTDDMVSLFAFCHRYRDRGMYQVCRGIPARGMEVCDNMQCWLLPGREDLR